jgi:hypothetical protein
VCVAARRVVGVSLCFGLGYGLTHRLLALQWPSLVRLGQGFEVRPFPGTSLESLRLRFGADSQEVRGTLDLLELERQTGADKSPAQPRLAKSAAWLLWMPRHRA